MRRSVRGAPGVTQGVVRGLAAAVGAPGVVRGRALDALLTPPSPAAPAATRKTTATATARTTAVARNATAVAFVALRTLEHLPAWRNTCLYRAVAECLVLRGLGLPATLRLGVAGAEGVVTAHAWVDCPGHRCRTADGATAAAYAVLRRTAAGRTVGTPA